MDLDTSIDTLEQELLAREEQISLLRREQAEAIHQLDMRQVRRVDGSRSLQEWVRTRLDVRCTRLGIWWMRPGSYRTNPCWRTQRGRPADLDFPTGRLRMPTFLFTIDQGTC